MLCFSVFLNLCMKSGCSFLLLRQLSSTVHVKVCFLDGYVDKCTETLARRTGLIAS